MIGRETRGTVFDIQHFAVHDGPGIRTLVFFKGCPLSCKWCANPESINPHPELGFIKSLCNGCGKCQASCPQHAISLNTQGKPALDRKACDNCGQCLDVCFPHALIMYGREQSANEVFEEVRQDSAYYSNTGGGVTLSGGEPLSQPSFASSILALCREAGIHTALETSGFAPGRLFKEILSLTDHIMFDLKLMDSKTHEVFCGRPNGPILENARIVASSAIPVIFRVPLVPGLNDAEANLGALANFLKDSGIPQCEVELLPYHRLGTPKYENLGREYTLGSLIPQTPAALRKAKTFLEEHGVSCTVNV
jgi:pyruvate formate lyase activating enzyme